MGSVMVGHRRAGRVIVTLAAFTVFALSGCGDESGATGGGFTEVVEITSSESSISVGEGAVVRVNFSFDQNDVFIDDGDVRLVVQLPAALSYRDESAELDRFGSRDRDTDPRVIQCASGETFLSFVFDESELQDVTIPSDGGDGQLKFTVDGKFAAELVAIKAAADDGPVIADCAVPFSADEVELVSVQ